MASSPLPFPPPRPKQLQKERITCGVWLDESMVALWTRTTAPILHELEDGRGLSGGGIACDDDTAVGGQVGGKVLGDLAVEPLAAHEPGARFAGGDLEEERLQRPVQLAVVGEGA